MNYITSWWHSCRAFRLELNRAPALWVWTISVQSAAQKLLFYIQPSQTLVRRLSSKQSVLRMFLDLTRFNFGGGEQGWGVLRASVNIGFLHLVVMYNSGRPVRPSITWREPHKNRMCLKWQKTQEGREEDQEEGRERLASMEEVVKKRPIISARERG